MRWLILFCVSLSIAVASRTWKLNDRSFEGRLRSNSNGLQGICGTVNQEAGYFDIQGSKNKHYFYWYFESRNDPSTDPVVLWMTGGPGCSSSVALFHENGPCKINDDHQTTSLNPYGWNSKANLLYIDQPAGVGFSYGDPADADHDEAEVAEDMYHFLHEFFAAHSELTNRPLFIFGESYGGHFAPATAFRVGKTLNLQGLGVGNGLTDPLVQYQYYPEMAYTYAQQRLGHPVVSKETYESMKASWPKCQSMIAKCQNTTIECSLAQAYCNEVMIGPYEQTGLNPYDIRIKCQVPPLCYDFSDVDDFLNNKTVRAALGVPLDMEWQSCNMTVNSAFSNDWMKRFQQDIPPLLANGTRVLIYAGDVDFICNWIGNKHWTLELDWSGKDQYNAAADMAWKYNGTEAALLRSYQGFSFMQIHNAGHMVPFDQPAIALEMLDDFLSNTL